MHIKCSCTGTLTDICGLTSTCKYKAVVEIVHTVITGVCVL